MINLYENRQRVKMADINHIQSYQNITSYACAEVKTTIPLMRSMLDLLVTHFAHGLGADVY